MFCVLYTTQFLVRFFILKVSKWEMAKRTNSSEKNYSVPKKKKVEGHWAAGLLKTMKDPDYIVETDNLVTIIRDMYPKAKYHYLVLPKEDLSSLKSLKKEHASLLKHMDKVAKDLFSEKHPNSVFKLGYHAEASMQRLHLHAISDDMDSVSLKTKKHWNSFCTDFFLYSNDVIKNLEENEKVVLPSREVCKKLMESPLKCHKCEYMPKNMPDLKKHISKHFTSNG